MVDQPSESSFAASLVERSAKVVEEDLFFIPKSDVEEGATLDANQAKALSEPILGRSLVSSSAVKAKLLRNQVRPKGTVAAVVIVKSICKRGMLNKKDQIIYLF